MLTTKLHLHLHQIVSIDKDKLQVTVQAGARVSHVTEAIKQHGMTLQNFASIAEQQVWRGAGRCRHVLLHCPYP